MYIHEQYTLIIYIYIHIIYTYIYIQLYIYTIYIDVSVVKCNKWLFLISCDKYYWVNYLIKCSVSNYAVFPNTLLASIMAIKTISQFATLSNNNCSHTLETTFKYIFQKVTQAGLKVRVTSFRVTAVSWSQTS